jgi:hypothetical protein
MRSLVALTLTNAIPMSVVPMVTAPIPLGLTPVNATLAIAIHRTPEVVVWTSMNASIDLPAVQIPYATIPSDRTSVDVNRGIKVVHRRSFVRTLMSARHEHLVVPTPPPATTFRDHTRALATLAIAIPLLLEDVSILMNVQKKPTLAIELPKIAPIPLVLLLVAVNWDTPVRRGLVWMSMNVPRAVFAAVMLLAPIPSAATTALAIPAIWGVNRPIAVSCNSLKNVPDRPVIVSRDSCVASHRDRTAVNPVVPPATPIAAMSTKPAVLVPTRRDKLVQVG